MVLHGGSAELCSHHLYHIIILNTMSKLTFAQVPQHLTKTRKKKVKYSTNPTHLFTGEKLMHQLGAKDIACDSTWWFC